MNLKMSRVDVWAAEIEDKPGGLTRTLQAIADRGVDLDCVIARREPDRPGRGVVFVAPSRGGVNLESDGDTGFHRAAMVATLKIEGSDEPGMGARIAKAVSDAGVNMRGVSAAVLGHRFVCFAGFDSMQDLERAETALKSVTTHHWLFRRRRHEPTAA